MVRDLSLPPFLPPPPSPSLSFPSPPSFPLCGRSRLSTSSFLFFLPSTRNISWYWFIYYHYQTQTRTVQLVVLLSKTVTVPSTSHSHIHANHAVKRRYTRNNRRKRWLKTRTARNKRCQLFAWGWFGRLNTSLKDSKSCVHVAGKQLHTQNFSQNLFGWTPSWPNLKKNDGLEGEKFRLAPPPPSPPALT